MDGLGALPTSQTRVFFFRAGRRAEFRSRPRRGCGWWVGSGPRRREPASSSAVGGGVRSMDRSMEGVGRGRIADEQAEEEAPAGRAAREKRAGNAKRRASEVCSFVVPPLSSHSVSRTQPAARRQLHQPINQPTSRSEPRQKRRGRTNERGVDRKTRPVCAEETGSTCRYGTETHSHEQQQQTRKTWSHSQCAWLVGWLVALMMTMVGGVCARSASAARRPDATALTKS